MGNWAWGIGHSFFLFPLPSTLGLTSVTSVTSVTESVAELPSSFFTFFPQHPTQPSSLQLELIPNYRGHFAASATIRPKPGARLFSNRLTLLRGQNPSGVADRQEFVEP